MEYLIYFVTFSLFLKITTCIQCYQCSEEKNYKGIPLCAHFDESPQFLVDCPSSTMCFKRTTALRTGTEFTSFKRGCAPQTLDGDQRIINRKWEMVTIIYEPYEEGCREDHADEDRLTNIVNCYCRGTLCNSSVINIPKCALIIVLLTIFKMIS